MIAARQIAFGGSAAKYTAADYVHDGLVAMWDGKESNDGTSDTIFDVSGNGHDLTIYQGSFGEDYFDATGTNYAGCNYPIAFSAIEVVITPFLNDALVISGNNVFISGNGGNYGRNVSVSGASIYYAQKNSVGIVYDTTMSNGMTYSISASEIVRLNGIELTSSGQNGQLSNYRPGVLSQIGWVKRDNSTSSRNGCGFIHNIRLYNRALTAEEIAYNYKIDKQRFGL